MAHFPSYKAKFKRNIKLPEGFGDGMTKYQMYAESYTACKRKDDHEICRMITLRLTVDPYKDEGRSRRYDGKDQTMRSKGRGPGKANKAERKDKLTSPQVAQ